MREGRIHADRLCSFGRPSGVLVLLSVLCGLAAHPCPVNATIPGPANAASPGVVLCGVIFQICPAGRHVRPAGHMPWRRVRGSPGNFVGKGDTRVYLRSQKCWDIRQKAPDARRMSAALLCGMQANATQQMGLFGRIEQRWGVFRYTLGGKHF